MGLFKSKTRSVVGLDIEPGFVAAAEFSQNGKPVLVRAATTSLGPGLFHEGEVVDVDALADRLRAFFRENDLPKKVRLGVASQKMAVRVMELPAIDDEQELDAAIRFQAQEELPMPIEQAVLDHRLLERIDDEQGGRMRILVVAARRDSVEHLLAAARRAGLTPELVDLSAFAMIRALYVPQARHYAMPDESTYELAAPPAEEPQAYEAEAVETPYEEPQEQHAEAEYADEYAPVETYAERQDEHAPVETLEEPQDDYVAVEQTEEPGFASAEFAPAYDEPVSYDEQASDSYDEPVSYDEQASDSYDEAPVSYDEAPDSHEEQANYDFGDPAAQRAPEPAEEPSAAGDDGTAWDDVPASSESLGTVYCYVGGLTNLAIAVGRTCFFNRVLQNGLESMAATLAERRGLTLDHSREWLRHVGLEREIDHIEGEREIIEEAREVLESGCRRIADEVRLSIEYYHSTVPNAPRVESAVLAGPGIAIAGLASLLEQELGLPVASRSMGVIEVRPGALDSVDGAHLTVATGLALDEVPA
jgi:Tfp pilus assembly PilM family ATPase